VVLTVGLNFIIAPLSVFLRDLERIVKLVTRLLFYAAPVLYSLQFGNPVLHFLYGLDPVVGFLELYRACFFPDVLDWMYVLQSAIISLILFAIGAVVFRRSVPRVLKEI
jgi:ABC-2 type transport system permease protein